MFPQVVSFTTNLGETVFILLFVLILHTLSTLAVIVCYTAVLSVITQRSSQQTFDKRRERHFISIVYVWFIELGACRSAFDHICPLRALFTFIPGLSSIDEPWALGIPRLIYTPRDSWDRLQSNVTPQSGFFLRDQC